MKIERTRIHFFLPSSSTDLKVPIAESLTGQFDADWQMIKNLYTYNQQLLDEAKYGMDNYADR